MIYCPTCEAGCSEKADVCPKCGHPLSEKGADGVVSILTIRGKPRYILATIVVGIAVGVPLYYLTPSGNSDAVLPTAIEIERTMNVWRFGEEQAILRGRPLKKILFTRDASRFDSPTPIELYLDSEGRSVAVVLAIENIPVSFETSIRQLDRAIAGDEDEERHQARLGIIEDFAHRYLHRMPLRPYIIQDWITNGRLDGRILKSETTDDVFGSGSITKEQAIFKHRGLLAEYILRIDKSSSSNRCSWIIRTFD
jgi:hypothetical protein